MRRTVDNSYRVGPRMESVLRRATDFPDGKAPSILALEPEEDRVHTYHYEAVRRCAARGLVRLMPPEEGKGNRIAVHVTERGYAALYRIDHPEAS